MSQPHPDVDFVREHLDAPDLHRLLLNATRYPGVDVPRAVTQIEALRKVRDKIPAWYSPTLLMPPLLSVEQASSEQAARYKASLLHGQRMADLTGGMGVDAFFWRESFAHVTYVEQNAALAAAARHNFEQLGASSISVLNETAEDFLGKYNEPLDLIYLDPARRDVAQRKVFQLADCQPDVVQLREQMLALAPQVLVKTAPLLDLRLACRQLVSVTRIWVVTVGNECKEVLYLLERDGDSSNPPITATHLNGEATTELTFTFAEEHQAPVAYALPQQFLYEPDAGILKAGAFRTFAARFGLTKLHPNTHLYTSEQFVPNVPGRTFEIQTMSKYDRRSVQQALGGEKKANVATRNFLDKADEVRQRLGLSDGGDHYLFATTLIDDRKAILITRKVV